MAEKEDVTVKGADGSTICEYWRWVWSTGQRGYSEVFVETQGIEVTQSLENEFANKAKLIRLVGNYSTLKVSKDHIDEVQNKLKELKNQRKVIGFDWVQFVDKVYLDTSVRRISGNPDTRAKSPVPRGAGKGVVIGIVDYGIDFRMDDFRWPAGKNKGQTRIEAIWDQSLPVDPKKDKTPRFGYGIEYDAADINRELAARDPKSNDSRPDRGAATLPIIQHRPTSPEFVDIDGHGTHVAGIAAGNGTSFDDRGWKEIPADKKFKKNTHVGMAPGSTLVFVNLPRDDIRKDTQAPASTLANSLNLAHAIAYCFEKAGDRPCVVNLSMGFYGGGHDGNMAVERIIDALVEEKSGRAVVVAAGNAGTSARHAGGYLMQKDATAELTWQIGWETPFPGIPAAMLKNGDPTTYEVEIWYSKECSLGIELISPDDGDSTGTVLPDNEKPWDFRLNGEKVTITSQSTSPWDGDARIHIWLTPGSRASKLRFGEWKIKLTAKSIDSRQIAKGGVRFDAWIEKTVPGFQETPLSEEQQSRFIQKIVFDPLDQGREEDSCTLNTPTTSRCAITVAAFKNNRPLPSRGIPWVPEHSDRWEKSSYGPARKGPPKPLVAAPGAQIVSSDAHAGKFHLGTFHSTRIAMAGTSMAAPHVTGVVARLLSEAKGTITSKKIHEILKRTAVRPEGSAPGWDKLWGYGMVRADAAIEELRRQMAKGIHTRDQDDTDWVTPPN